MKKRYLTILSLFLQFSSPTLFAGVCDGVAHGVIPATDYPSAAEKIEFKDKSCLNYRYGFGVKKDLIKYRKCLLSQQNNEVDVIDMYASGLGVRKNRKLAIRLVCNTDDANSDSETIINALKNEDELFDYCSVIEANMGGNEDSFCSDRFIDIQVGKYNSALDAMMSTWPQSHQVAFKNLRDKADAYFKAHADLENTNWGTDRYKDTIDESLGEINEFLITINKFEKGVFPHNDNYSSADKNLNATYTKTMHCDRGNDYHFNLDDCKETERKWIKYKEAWIEFAGLHFPQLKPQVLQTWLTEKRIKELDGLSCESNT